MKFLSRMTACAVAITVAGCATRPENVIPQYTSTGKYDSYDCQRLMRDAYEVNTRARQLTFVLSDKANTDAALVGVGLVLFWPALLVLPVTGGKQEEAELGRLKGESEAIQRAFIEKNCASAAAPTATSPIVAPAVTTAVTTPVPSSNSTATSASTPVLTIGRGQSSSFIDLRPVSCRLVDGTVETLPRTTCTDRSGTVIQSK